MTGTFTLPIDDAKLNSKYYLDKKFKPGKPRVRDADIGNFKHYCDSEGITVSVVGNTVTLSKAIEGPSKTIVFDGRDTGGQFIRLAVTYLINLGEGRKNAIKTIELPKFTPGPKKRKGKAILLMVQMAKMTLGEGESADFCFGDKLNTDARSSTDMPELFDLLRNVFGINFTMDEYQEDCFRVERLEDCPRKDIGTLKIDNHLSDEVLFTAIVLWSQGKEIPCIEIDTPVSWDYHIAAMIKFGRGLGITIEDSKPSEGINEWVKAGGTRKIKILGK